MDSNGRSRNHRVSPSSDRFLGAFITAVHPSEYPSTSNTANNDINELSEDDILFSPDFCIPSHTTADHHHPSPSPSSSHSPRHYNKSFHLPESFGILAALAKQEEPSLKLKTFRNASISSSVSTSTTASASSSISSSRLIPSIPKAPQDRRPVVSSWTKFQQHQSAPLNVPVMGRVRRHQREFDDIEDEGEEEEEDGEMLPPHEIAAKGSVQSPLLACSVLEGVGRTLKGRDLRQVRNAVWRQTGFLD